MGVLDINSIMPGLSQVGGPQLPQGVSFGQQAPLVVPGGPQPVQAPSSSAPPIQAPPQYAPPPTTQAPPSPADYLNDPRLTTSLQNYTNLAGQAASSQAQEYTLPAMLRDALAKKFADNPLVQTRQDQTQNLLNILGGQNASMMPQNNNGVIFNPAQQADLLSKQRAAAVAPLATTNYLLGLQTGGIQTVIDAAANAQKAQTANLQAKADIQQTNYKDILDQLSKEADLAMRQKELTAQYGDPQSLKAISDLFTGTTTSNATTQGNVTPSDVNPLSQLRTAAQQMYSSTTNPKLQSLIEQQWMNKSGGKPLFPTPLTAQEESQVSDQTQTMQYINQAIALLKSGTSTGGVGGNLNAFLMTHPELYSNADPKLQQLNEIFTKLSAAGERGLIGGRLQAVLLSMTKSAFPSVRNGTDTNLRQLEQLQNAAKNDLTTLASTKGLLSTTQLPNYTNATIPMREKDSGKIVYTDDPARDFDPTKYELVTQ